MTPQEKIEKNIKLKTMDIADLYDDDAYFALDLASEHQVITLIDMGIMEEDDLARWDNVQEEMRCELAYV